MISVGKKVQPKNYFYLVKMQDQPGKALFSRQQQRLTQVLWQ